MAKKIFVGSSGKNLDKANYLKYLIKSFGADVSVWKEDPIFPLTETTIESLMNAVDNYSGAVFFLGRDDKLETADEKGNLFVPRDNVLFEAGLFQGRLGRSSIVLCVDAGVHIPSDFHGVTILHYSPADPSEMNAKLKYWLDNNVPNGPILHKSNVWLSSRDDIHRHYPVEQRFQLDDEGYRHITKIRLLNLAGNLILNPDVSEEAHQFDGRTGLSELFKLVLANRKATVDLILAHPEGPDMKCANQKIRNQMAGGCSEGSILSAWASLYQMLYLEEDSNVFSRARRGCARRFNIRALNLPMSYAIFNLEFDEEYEAFDHIKIDLYSLSFSTEGDRRCFIIWKRDDAENYNFFKREFNALFGLDNEELLCKPSKDDMKKWADKWNELQR